MDYTLGFIGTGNMGGSLAEAASKFLSPDKIILADRNTEKAQALASRIGCKTGTNEAACQNSRFLFLGIKPHLMASALAPLQSVFKNRAEPPILISMAAGLTIQQIQTMSGGSYPVIRIMPNTPVSQGAGVILYDRSKGVSDTDCTEFTTIMSGAGKLYPLDESLIDAGSAVSGCGPAFVYLFIDALADGGVSCGLSRSDALEFATQTVMGAAKMILTTGKHPDQLKNDVCSPGGSTIQGVRTLEQRAFRSAAIDAVISAYEKTKALGQS